MRISKLANSPLPTTANHIINDSGLAAIVGLPRTTISHYRRGGTLPPYDLVMPGLGHGGWLWSSVETWANLIRLVKVAEMASPREKHRAVVKATAQAWPALRNSGSAA